MHTKECINKWIKFFICTGAHLSPAIYFDGKAYLLAHANCAIWYEHMNMDEVAKALGAEHGNHIMV